jgi:choline dehydrogenase-like flavoprotein
MKTITTEVLTIGSGFGAAAPALRLSQAGFQVLMVEKGPGIIPGRDFKQTSDPKYLLKYLKGMSSEDVSFTYAEGLGGGSGFYEMVSLRAPSKVFEQMDREGNRLWPKGLDRSIMEAYYDRAEELLHVKQIGLNEIPKSGVAFSLLMKNLGYSCDRARYAVDGCMGSGFCVSGCIFGAKQSLHLNYLPQSTSAGMKVLTDIEAYSMRSLCPELARTRLTTNVAALPYRYEVLCRNSNTGEEFTVQAKLVILGGGTIGTAKLLLRSRGHLPLLSEQVGKNIAVNGSVKAVGLLPKGFMDGDMFTGRSHPGMISYEFLDRLGVTVSSAKPLPLQIVAEANLYLSGETRNPISWGEANVELMKLSRRRMIVLYALGLTPPAGEILRDANDSFTPYLKIDDELRSYYTSTKELLHSIFRRNGCKIVDAKTVDHEGTEYRDIHFDTAHMVGSCRMAEDKENGVVDAFGEVFDYPGLYITDGSVIPTSLAVNSSLTILANAERIASHLVRWYHGSIRTAYRKNDLLGEQKIKHTHSEIEIKK